MDRLRNYEQVRCEIRKKAEIKDEAKALVCVQEGQQDLRQMNSGNGQNVRKCANEQTLARLDTCYVSI